MTEVPVLPMVVKYNPLLLEFVLCPDGMNLGYISWLVCLFANTFLDTREATTKNSLKKLLVLAKILIAVSWVTL